MGRRHGTDKEILGEIMDPYSTHIPVTALALCRTAELFPDMPIMECGCGDYSTPMIELLKHGREHHVYSSDPSWYDRYRDIVDEIVHIDLAQPHRWAGFSVDHEYGLCLMDSEELTVFRREHISGLLDVCRVVMMHDATMPLAGKAKYEYFYNRYSPWTWIGSHTVDVVKWFPKAEKG